MSEPSTLVGPFTRRGTELSPRVAAQKHLDITAQIVAAQITHNGLAFFLGGLEEERIRSIQKTAGRVATEIMWAEGFYIE